MVDVLGAAPIDTRIIGIDKLASRVAHAAVGVRSVGGAVSDASINAVEVGNDLAVGISVGKTVGNVELTAVISAHTIYPLADDVGFAAGGVGEVTTSSIAVFTGNIPGAGVLTGVLGRAGGAVETSNVLALSTTVSGVVSSDGRLNPVTHASPLTPVSIGSVGALGVAHIVL